MPSVAENYPSPFNGKNDTFLDTKDLQLEKRLAGLHEETSVGSKSELTVSFNDLPPRQKRVQLEEYVKLWGELHQSEGKLLGQAEKYLGNSEGQPVSKLASDIFSFVERKNKILKELSEISREITVFHSQASSIPLATKSFPELRILQQPGEIFNSLITPGPILHVNNFQQWLDNGPLTIRVTMLYAANDRAVISTTEEEVLQGETKVSVDSTGTASFSSLRIEELCSKDRRQTFLLEFLLEDHLNGMPRVLATVKSDIFTLQVRPSVIKRKREQSDDELNYRPSRQSDTEPEFKERRVSPEYNYVDITELLTLPQKEAAQKLGISESMLCKRFKECTRRKWPYRYLCKIDKVMSLLHQQSEGQLSEEDRVKLESLRQEREECLQPVKIRIIPHESGDSSPFTSTRSPHSPPSPAESLPSEISMPALGVSMRRNNSFEVSSPESVPLELTPLSPSRSFSDEEQVVLETLGMLKSDRKLIPVHSF